MNQSSTDSESGPISLHKWISNKNNNQYSLENQADQLIFALNQFNSNFLEELSKEVKSITEEANNNSMKEIKGLEERLYGLEKLMCQAKKVVKDQEDLAQAFHQNQIRASNLRDPSIFPGQLAFYR